MQITLSKLKEKYRTRYPLVAQRPYITSREETDKKRIEILLKHIEEAKELFKKLKAINFEYGLFGHDLDDLLKEIDEWLLADWIWCVLIGKKEK